MKLIHKISFTAIGLLLAPISCEAASENRIVAKVNGAEITKDDVVARLYEYRAGNESALGTPAESAALKDKVVRELIEESVMLAEAKKRKLSIAPDELEKAVREVTKDYPEGAFDEMLATQKMSRSRWRQRMETKLLLEKVTSAVTQGGSLPKLDAIETYYKTHMDDFRTQEQWHLVQIVLKSREDGDRILTELKSGKTFEELARAHSFTPEAAQGGDLGFLPRGAMPKPIEDALEKLAVGKVTGVVETEYGFHIVKILEKKPATILSLAEATPSIMRILTQEDREKRFATWRQEALSKAKIERNHGLLESIR